MDRIDRDELKRMMDEDAVAVIEVLDSEYYRKFHLPQAINVPLSGDFDREIQQVVRDKSQPVAVYCMDEDCPASPQAADRMEELGYSRVYDYVEGKMGWKEAGLPIES
ncbi:MAG TPA: rhodanese-like domain-containing protein [Alphaproteobacteria bacterium]|jgi:rhodanese-related sulfurtransferase|nr:rhodanese-like domain-containing protein [Alphaproteobacteria bacterium]